MGAAGSFPWHHLSSNPGGIFGVDDQPVCPYYERQTFICYVCRYESQRSAAAGGNPYN